MLIVFDYAMDLDSFDYDLEYESIHLSHLDNRYHLETNRAEECLDCNHQSRTIEEMLVECIQFRLLFDCTLRALLESPHYQPMMTRSMPHLSHHHYLFIKFYFYHILCY